MLNKINYDNIGKKGENLLVLKEYMNKVSGFKVPEFITIGEDDFYNKLEEILNKFNGKKVAVRSSSFTEDTDNNSNAGSFETILNVEVNEESLKKAYNEIQDHAKKKFGYEIPVVVQEMVKNINYSGVVFSKDPDTFKDYIVINYHLGIGEDLVSGNASGKVIKYLSYFIPEKDIFSKLARIVKEIEQFYGKPVDIEFAIDDNDNVYLLQLRPITTIKGLGKTHLLTKRYASFLQYLIEKKDLVLGDMIDINPEELVGNQPYLIKSFFDRLFVKGVLKDSRKDFGYSYEEFGVFVLDKYYLDLEKNLVSFLPASLSENEKSYFIDYYKKLVKDDISLQKQLDSKFYPINMKRVREVVSFLNIGKNEKENIIGKFEIFFKQLEDKLEVLANTYEDKEKEILSKLGVKNYYELIKLDDLDISLNDLLELIKETARYFVDYARGAFYYSSLQESNPSYFKSYHYLSSIVKNSLIIENSTEKIIKFKNVEGFNFLKLLHQEINIDDLKKERYGEKFNGKYSNIDIFLVGRENFKFIFMNLFRILHKKIDIFDGIEYVSFTDLINGNINKARILHNKKKKELYELLLFPSVFFSENTPACITKFDSKGFFIGKGIVKGEICYVNDISKLEKKYIKGKILFLENATPEVDVFLPYVKGIITKNGGPLAHIAIRARELGIPVVVGIGEKFDKIVKSENIEIDFNLSEIRI